MGSYIYLDQHHLIIHFFCSQVHMFSRAQPSTYSVSFQVNMFSRAQPSTQSVSFQVHMFSRVQPSTYSVSFLYKFVLLYFSQFFSLFLGQAQNCQNNKAQPCMTLAELIMMRQVLSGLIVQDFKISFVPKKCVCIYQKLTTK